MDMVYLTVDDNFTENPKVESVSDRAFRLHVRAMVLCARTLTNGLISDTNLRVLTLQTRAKKVHVEELVAAGLWLADDGNGFEIHDFLDYNRTAEEVKDARKKNAERQRKNRARNALHNDVRNDVDNALHNALRNGGSNAPPSLPFPAFEPPVSTIRSLPLPQGTDKSPLGKLRRACNVDEASVDERKLVRAMRGVAEADVDDIAFSCPRDVRSRLGWTLAELKKRRQVA